MLHICYDSPTVHFENYRFIVSIFMLLQVNISIGGSPIALGFENTSRVQLPPLHGLINDQPPNKLDNVNICGFAWH